MRRRAVVTLAVVVLVATVAALFVQGARAWGVTGDRQRRAQEIVARESYLYRQLANREAVLESQRRMYMERLRRLESLLRQRDEDVAVLRERLRTMRSMGSNEIETRVIARHVQGQSSSPSTGGPERSAR